MVKDNLIQMCVSICETARIELVNRHIVRQGGFFLGPYHSHPDLYQISYVLHGQSEIVVNRRSYRVQAGQMLCLPPRSWHGTQDYNQREKFEVAEIKFSITPWRLLRLPVLVTLHEPEEWFYLFEQLLDEYLLTRPRREVTMRLLLAQLLVVIVRDMAWQHSPRPLGRRQMMVITKRRARIRSAILFMRQHYRESVSLAEAARSVSMSNSAFSHEFLRATGISPIRYLINYRLAQAAAQIGISGEKIATIAEEVGFSSLYYFSRQFKRRYGLSPTAYGRRDLSCKIVQAKNNPVHLP